MAQFAKAYAKLGFSVLDVGSYNYNGCYKNLFNKCNYVGLDMKNGPNVDVVSAKPYDYPFESNSFDIVISGQCLEHSFHPWLVVKEIYRVTKIGGITCIIAPWQWPIHRYPVDCFRILPDGMKQMMKDAGFQSINCAAGETDCYGIGAKIN
jgi:SAM-dependent methyltransferase